MVEQGSIFHEIIPAHYTFLAMILLVRLKKLHTSPCMNLDYGTAKQYPKMVRFIKTGDQYSHKFNFGHFFSSAVKM